MKNNVIIQVGESVQIYDGSMKRTFTIINAGDNEAGTWYKQGGSAICFDAYFVDSDGFNHYGKLKKFYLDDENMDFAHEAEAYISSYKRLYAIASNAKGKTSIYAFVPEFQIYYDADECPYIWTNSVPMKTFGVICRQLMISNVRVEDALFEITTTLKSVTDCIRILHENNLIHGDITPENFGFYLRDGKTLADAVSLFDLNTLRDISQQPKEYTPPYYDKIVGDDKLLNRADIRALGITLCKAIGLNNCQVERIRDARKNNTSNNKTRKALRTIIEEAELFLVKGVPVDAHVMRQLIDIISEAVTYINNRRISCTKLIQRLQTLETYLLPYCTKDELGRGLGIEIVNKAERRKDKIHEVFQYLLYDRPLYNWQKGDEIEKFGIIIVGFGLDAQKFLDVCLETAQSMNQELVVDVWGTQRIKSEKEYYLSERPALSQFFLVDDNEEKLTGDSYGSIKFHVREKASLPKEVEKIISDSKNTRYVYIAAGNDGENSDIAKAFSEILSGENVSINAQCEYDRKDTDNIHYVFADMDVRKNKNYADIERLSFNTHLVWSGSLNADLQRKKDEYEAEYYHASCLSNVLSIKYKLHYLGIEFDNGLYEAANEFLSRYSSGSAVKRKIIAAEHKRWVTEKLCDGWMNMRVEDSVRYNDTKDIRGKKHICIVRSSENCGWGGEWTNHKMWDSADEKKIGELDELDAMSVKLHQAYKKYSNTEELDSLFAERISESVMDLSKGMERVQRTFIEWMECLRELYNAFLAPRQATGKEGWTISEYDMLYSKLLNDLDDSKEKDELKKIAIRDKAATIHNAFVPIARCLKFHDYKKNDTDLIDNIPFILSYSENITMIVPVDYDVLSTDWKDAKPSKLFSYVAAATVVNPRTLYLPYIAPEKEKKEITGIIEQKITCINDYFRRKRLQTNVRFERLVDVVTVERLLKNDVMDNSLFVENNGNAAVEFDKECKIDGAIVYTFDMLNIRFRVSDDAKWVNSINRNVWITARDVGAFLGCTVKVGNQPSLGRDDNKKLFEIYKSDRIAWKNICALLKTSENKNNSVLRFDKITHDIADDKKEGQVYILPYTCYRSAGKILRLFKNYRIISDKSCIYRYSIDACKIIIYENSNCGEILKKIFSKLDVLSSEYEFGLSEENGKYVLCSDSLEIENIKYNFAKDRKSQDMLHTLLELQQAGFLRIKQKKEAFDIIYGSRQIKKLFMAEGNFLEVYTYYKSKELNSFDDVVTGIKFDRLNGGQENEIDCLITKGFRTIIVECKARAFKHGQTLKDELKDIKKKLSDNVKKYGINGKGLLVIDSETRILNVGGFDDVTVCSDFNEITDIGRIVSAQIKEYVKSE